MSGFVFTIEKVDFNLDQWIVYKARTMEEAIAVGWELRKEDVENFFKETDRSFWIKKLKTGDSIKITRNPDSDFSWKEEVPVSKIEWFFKEPASKEVIEAAVLLDDQVEAAKALSWLANGFKWEWRKEKRKVGEVFEELFQDYEDFLWSWGEWDEKAQKWVFCHKDFE